MSHVEKFVRNLADEDCRAAAFYEEKTLEPKCLDANYNEYPNEIELCEPCAARRALKLDQERLAKMTAEGHAEDCQSRDAGGGGFCTCSVGTLNRNAVEANEAAGAPAVSTSAYEYRCDAGHVVYQDQQDPTGEVDCLECGDQDNSCYDPDCCGGPWPYFPPMYLVTPTYKKD